MLALRATPHYYAGSLTTGLVGVLALFGGRNSAAAWGGWRGNHHHQQQYHPPYSAKTLVTRPPRAVMASSSSSRLWASTASPNVGAHCGVALITGTTDGIGITTAKHIASKGTFHTVVLHGRDARRMETSRRVIEEFLLNKNGKSCKTRLVSVLADLSTLQGCHDYVAQVQEILQQEEASLSLDLVMHNAGVFSNRHVMTADGLELTFAVNVLAPFVITSLLLPQLLEQTPQLQQQQQQQRRRRVVIASSVSQSRSIQNWKEVEGRRRNYSAHQAYGESKLLVAMLSMEFAKRWESSAITCNCLDPGTVNTKMLLDGWGPIGMDVKDALGETWLCTSEDVEGVSGKYFIGQSECMASAAAYNQEEREQLWTILKRWAPKAAGMWDRHV